MVGVNCVPRLSSKGLGALQDAEVAYGSGAGPFVGGQCCGGDVRCLGKFFLDELGKVFFEGGVGNTGEDIFEKSKHQQPMGMLRGDASGVEVEEVFGVKGAGGSAVGAFDVVVADF